MITNDDENWHYLIVKSISRLLRGITSNHDEDFCYLNCFHSYRTKERLKKHEKVRKDHDYCYAKMPDEDKKKNTHTHTQSSRKLIQRSVYDLCRLRAFAWKNRHMSK